MQTQNPLLNYTQKPQFENIYPALLTPALDISIKNAADKITQIENETNITWDSIVKSLDEAMLPLGYAWGIARHLSSVCDTKEWRDVIDENLERVTEFWTSIGQNEILYKHYKSLLAQSNELNLNFTQIKILEDSILDFKLGGAELVGEDKEKYINLQNEQANLTKNISDHVLDANDRFAYIVTRENIHELDGVPEHILNNLKQEDTSYKVTIHTPVYIAIMQYCTNRKLRELLYKAVITRASEITEFSMGEKEWDNAPLITQLLTLRQQEAYILGYQNFAEVSLATKMAAKPQVVLDFIENISIKAKKNAIKDFNMLQEFAKTQDIENLELWDISYISELLRQQQYSFSEQEVQKYFTVDTVLLGLFNIIENLFKVQIVEQQAQTWHKDVRFFAISKDNQEIAHFYLDLYARTGKRSGAWMNSVCDKRLDLDGKEYTPIAYLICNFSKSIDENTASIITHDDVITLFHECGHGLHHMLTSVYESGASGINGVEWDAVELPSQFMENFCWEYDIVKTLTKHIDTNEILPIELFNKMLAAKNFLSGLFVLRQTTFSMLDMQAHLQPVKDINALAKTIHEQYHITPQLEISRWANTFTHVFAGGYAAGYYSYHWAEVLSSDVFSAFEEAKKINGSVLNHEVGRRYLENILQAGGSRPALENFKAFMGREPDISAFLRHNGLIDEAV